MTQTRQFTTIAGSLGRNVTGRTAAAFAIVTLSTSVPASISQRPPKGMVFVTPPSFRLPGRRMKIQLPGGFFIRSKQAPGFPYWDKEGIVLNLGYKAQNGIGNSDSPHLRVEMCTEWTGRSNFTPLAGQHFRTSRGRDGFLRDEGSGDEGDWSYTIIFKEDENQCMIFDFYFDKRQKTRIAPLARQIVDSLTVEKCAAPKLPPEE